MNLKGRRHFQIFLVSTYPSHQKVTYILVNVCTEFNSMFIYNIKFWYFKSYKPLFNHFSQCYLFHFSPQFPLPFLKNNINKALFTLACTTGAASLLVSCSWQASCCVALSVRILTCKCITNLAQDRISKMTTGDLNSLHRAKVDSLDTSFE